MKIIIYLLFFIPFCAFGATDVSVKDALINTYNSCIGIEDKLQDIKKMAGINTAVTAVGTGTGVGATAVGIAKYGVDKDVEDLKTKLNKLRELSAEKDHKNDPDVYKLFRQNTEKYDTDRLNDLIEKYGSIEENTEELEKLTQKSKKLGNWRTGLLATSGAIGVAGAVIASQNKIDDDLGSEIRKCSESVDVLKKSVAVARISGDDIFDSQEIIDACGQYEYIDIKSINNRARNAEISSIVTAATGTTGAILSGIANSDSVRNNGGQKEKNLNLSSNIMSVGATLSGGVATIFNASQISLIKKTAEVASLCSKVLKG